MTDSPDRTSRTDDRTYSAEEGRKHWSAIMGKVRFSGEHVTITYSGRPAAKIVPISWYNKHAAHDDDSGVT